MFMLSEIFVVDTSKNNDIYSVTIEFSEFELQERQRFCNLTALFLSLLDTEIDVKPPFNTLNISSSKTTSSEFGKKRKKSIFQ